MQTCCSHQDASCAATASNPSTTRAPKPTTRYPCSIGASRVALNLTLQTEWLTDPALRELLLDQLLDQEQFDVWYVRVLWPNTPAHPAAAHSNWTSRRVQTTGTTGGRRRPQASSSPRPASPGGCNSHSARSGMGLLPPVPVTGSAANKAGAEAPTVSSATLSRACSTSSSVPPTRRSAARPGTCSAPALTARACTTGQCGTTPWPTSTCVLDSAAGRSGAATRRCNPPHRPSCFARSQCPQPHGREQPGTSGRLGPSALARKRAPQRPCDGNTITPPQAQGSRSPSPASGSLPLEATKTSPNTRGTGPLHRPAFHKSTARSTSSSRAGCGRTHPPLARPSCRAARRPEARPARHRRFGNTPHAPLPRDIRSPHRPAAPRRRSPGAESPAQATPVGDWLQG